MEDYTFLAGDRVTFADLMVLPIISYFALTVEGRAILEPHPRLRAWADRMEKRESAAQVLAAA